MEPVNLSLQNITRRFGERTILQDFSLTIDAGSVTCLFGPSGCGKTTLLNILGGLIKPDSGIVEGYYSQRFSYIFQEVRILPWKTVLGNVIFPLTGLMPHDQAVIHAREFIRMVGLDKEENLYPGQLSGGMKQRVSIARAFAYPSSVILMDEAFQNLDNKLKYNILESFRQIWSNDRRTVVFVTHDEDEALYLGGEIILLDSQPLKIIKRVNSGEIPVNNWKAIIKEIYNQ